MTCVGRQIEQRKTFRKSQQEKSSASHLLKCICTSMCFLSHFLQGPIYYNKTSPM